jgi:endonuclease/exonuclease/phosphatase (EEP) superfamily protein YafD
MGQRRRSTPAVVSWLTAGALAAWAAARATGVDRHHQAADRSVPLLSFTPWAAAAAPPAALGLALARRPRPALLAALAGAVLVPVVASRAVRHPQPPADGPVLRILTANILNGRASADAIVCLARCTHSDVVALQEVTEDAVPRLKQAGLDELLPHTVAGIRGNRALGSAIYARHPLSDGPAIPPAHAAQPTARLTLPTGHVVDLLCVHPHAPIPPWHTGVAWWRRELAALPGPAGPPTVIAGDFNATLDHWQLRRLLRLGYVDAAAQTGRGLIPTWGPVRRLGLLTIDHVLLDRRCAVLRTSVHDLPGSDHRALYAEVRLPA